MQYEKKFFGAGTGNFDDADFAIEENQWVNMENCRVGSTDFPTGAIGYVEEVGSTELIASALPSSQNYCIAAEYEQARNRIVFLLWNSLGFHQIRVFDISAQLMYVALYDSQVEGGLGFEKNHVPDLMVVNGIAYWTDDLNEPKKLNIDAAIKMNYPAFDTEQDPYTSPLDYTTLTIIRQPPTYPLTVSKAVDGTVTNNFTGNEAMMFYYRYYYRDGEYSVISTNSRLIAYNYDEETFNSVTIAVPNTVFIEQDVQRIEIIVQYGNGGKMAIIKSWDKQVPSQAQEIEDHNDVIGQLTFAFLNNVTGLPIDNATSVKPFDRVPLLAKTNENGRNRNFFGNVLLGYDTPASSSLELALVEVEEGGGQIAYWNDFTLEIFYGGLHDDPTITDVYIVQVPGLSPEFYYFASVAPPTVPPDPVDLGTADFSSDNFAEVLDFIAGDPDVPIIPNSNGITYTSTVSGGTTELSDGTRVFKSDSTYRVAVVFYDRFRRKCGVVLLDNNSLNTPERTYDQTLYNISIGWTLSNADALNEIPDWAYYYQIVRTKNLTAAKFMQARAKNITYVLKANDGTLSYATSAYANTNYAIGVDISALNGFGIGYIYQEGDLVNLFFDSVPAKVQLPVIGQDGKWLLCGLKDLGTLDNTVDLAFEIFTPYSQQINEFYYEVGAVYPVTNPATGSRQYSTLAGTLNGDIYLLIRDPDTLGAYLVEAMSPNDKYWFNWYSDIGWPNQVDYIGQVRLKDSVLWSQTLIEGTRVNGLSSYDALAQADIPLECGPIQKLVVTSKVNNEQGAVMLAICSRETASMYLGETQLVASAANAFVAQSAGVIGTINILKGSYGTANPESVVQYRGNVYWFDKDNGRFIQYSLNGLFPISNYKATKFWKLFAEQYASMSEAEIEALGSRPFVFSAIDPRHNELLVSVPKLSDTPPRGYMPDYPSMIYPWDILDFQAKALVYKLEKEPNYWQGAYNIPAEMFVDAQDELYAFKDGSMYVLNSQSSFSNFFGVQYKPRIMFVSNQVPNRPKSYNNVAVEVNKVPTFTYFWTQAPYQQSSDLMDFDFTTLEGNYYAPVYRNKLVPTATGMLTSGLLTAEKMRSIALRVLIEWTSNNIPLQLRFVTVGYSLSLGHTT